MPVGHGSLGLNAVRAFFLAECVKTIIVLLLFTFRSYRESNSDYDVFHLNTTQCRFNRVVVDVQVVIFNEINDNNAKINNNFFQLIDQQ